MPRPHPRTALFTLAIVASVRIASTASAQLPVHPLQRDPCLDTISAAAMTRVLVYLHPRVIGDSSVAAINAAGLFAQDAAAALRPLLGDTVSAVPRGEPRLRWRQVRGAMGVILFRDGQHRTDGADSLDDAMSLLARAVASLRPAAEADLVPAGGPDSLRIALEFEWPTVDGDGRPTSLEARPLIPAFTIAHPWVDPVAPLQSVKPSYPEQPRHSNVEGTVYLTFIVDTSGRADPSTFRDPWPAGRPRPTGDEADWWNAFVAAARQSVEQSTFRPARIGGCPIRQLVRQPFAFRLNR